MKKRIVALFLGAALLTGLLAGCSGGGSAAEITAELEPTPMEPAEVSPDDMNAILQFSHQLFNQVLDGGEENPVISPLSAYYALAMVALGAEGDTLLEFAQVLGAAPEDLAAQLHSLTAELTDTRGNTVMNIADSIWVSDEFTVSPDFAQSVVDYFDAQVFSEDFADPATVTDVNSWVSDKTEGLIDQLIDSISEDTAMMLINTLYFSAKWAEAFNPMTVTEEVFYPAHGAAVETEFLSTGLGLHQVLQADGYEGALLPYDDGKTGFLIVRPTDGTDIREFAAGISVPELLADMEEREDTEISMPKFDLDFQVTMNDLLENMGLERAFTDSAELGGLLEEDRDLFISLILQKVNIRVDEEGTEAAAATYVGIETMSLPMAPLYLTFDSPYLYAVCDLETGIPLFVGVMDTPTA